MCHMHRRSRRISVLVVASLCSAVCSAPQPASSTLKYPATRTVNVVDDYHGTKVPDPYRWLEDLASQEARVWAAAQTALAQPVIRQNEFHPWLLKRMEVLAQPWDAFDQHRDRPLIDAKALGEGKSVAGTWLSPDRKFAAYGVSDRGSEWLDTRIRRLSDGKDLDDRLDGWLWSDAIWTKDSRGFFYVRSVRPAPSERIALKAPGIYYHVAGTPQSADIAIFRTPESTRDLVLEQEASDDGRFLFIYEGNGAHVDGLGWMLTRMHLLDLGNPGRPVITAPVVPLTAERDAAYRAVATDGDTIYVFTDHNAPRRRIVAIDVKQPAPDRWRDVVGQTDDVMDAVYDVNGKFAVAYLRNVQHGVRVFGRDGKLIRELEIPAMSRVMEVRQGERRDELLVDVMGFYAPPVRSRFDLTTGKKVAEPALSVPFSASDFEVNQVWYASKDGTRVPMFVLHRRGLVRDGSHPAVVIAYGASGTVMGPGYAENAIAALELGMVIAVPALRGGGEFGRGWYDAATLERKQNTFDDIIAAAEFLIAERYTSPERMGLSGASNGGLAVTAVMTQRPDLFRAVVAEVPMSDALRYDRGRHNPQFGSSSNPAHFPFLYAYSPQHRIKPRTCYPSTFVTTAMNDDRAPAWLALKFTAALQAAQSCDRPVILRADTGGGHSGEFQSDASDALAFLAKELGVNPPAAGRNVSR